MKPKNLKKKIRQLEKRLREGPKKLAKLKRKLQAAEAKKPAKAQEKKLGVKAKAAGAKSQSAPMKVKRKLNLSPERRAQLSAAMKARWAAKRAAAAPNTPTASPDPSFPSAGPI